MIVTRPSKLFQKCAVVPLDYKYIFQFLTPTLPIHYVTFTELR